MSKPYRCPRCWSYDLIPLDTYNRMVNIAVNMGENPGPLIDAAIAICEVQGLTMRPLKTLGLIKRIIDEAGRRRISNAASVVPSGEDDSGSRSLEDVRRKASS